MRGLGFDPRLSPVEWYPFAILHSFWWWFDFQPSDDESSHQKAGNHVVGASSAYLADRTKTWKGSSFIYHLLALGCKYAQGWLNPRTEVGETTKLGSASIMGLRLRALKMRFPGLSANTPSLRRYMAVAFKDKYHGIIRIHQTHATYHGCFLNQTIHQSSFC